MLIDITPALHADVAPWPGDPRYARDEVSGIDSGACVSQLHMSLHVGAHVDAPAHTLRDGATIDQLDPTCFFGPCLVVDLDALAHAPLTQRRLLVRTGYPRDRTRFHAGFRGLPLATLARLTDLRLVGTDAPGVDPFDSEDLPVHRWLAARGVPALEGLDLTDVPVGPYTLIALPLRLAGAEASPVRAVLSPAAP